MTVNAAAVHATPATDLDKWWMHVPVSENWALHFLGFVGARTRRYAFWDYHKQLERGIGLRGNLSSVLIGFPQENGAEARTAGFSRHVVVEPQTAPGEWWLRDPDYGVIAPHSLHAIGADPALVPVVYRQWAERHTDLDEFTRTSRRP